MTDLVVGEDLWDDDTEGNLHTWIYPAGAQVSKGEVVAEIMVEKLQVDIVAPESGVIEHGKAEGDLVVRGESIGRIVAA